MAMAKVREKEKDRIYERKLLKERKLEDDEFKDKEKFMTEAYKQKLKEDNKWNYEDRFVRSREALFIFKFSDLLHFVGRIVVVLPPFCPSGSPKRLRRELTFEVEACRAFIQIY